MCCKLGVGVPEFQIFWNLNQKSCRFSNIWNRNKSVKFKEVTGQAKYGNVFIPVSFSENKTLEHAHKRFFWRFMAGNLCNKIGFVLASGTLPFFAPFFFLTLTFSFPFFSPVVFLSYQYLRIRFEIRKNYSKARRYSTLLIPNCKTVDILWQYPSRKFACQCDWPT